MGDRLTPPTFSILIKTIEYTNLFPYVKQYHLIKQYQYIVGRIAADNERHNASAAFVINRVTENSISTIEFYRVFDVFLTKSN